MTTIKRLAFALTLTCFALAVSAQAQTPSIEVTTDSDAAQFQTQGKARSVRVEVYAPSGELVFEGDSFDGQAIEWQLRNQKGERMPDGVYLATITITDSAGKRRKRIEQLTISHEAQQVSESATAGASPEPTAVAPISGEGTTGKIARFTGTNAIGNSVLSESANKIGINTTAAPTSVLQVNQAQPAPLATNGAAAVTLFQTSGGKGGNTTGTTGQKAGSGASLSLLAGNGGDAPAGSTRGTGGSITLQPGGAGGGTGIGGVAGNVLLAPTAGNVGVGTTTPASKLAVNGQIQILGAGNGIKFADGSIQTKANNMAIDAGAAVNRIPKFTGANSFGNSAITEVAGKVGIGTTTPAVPGLHIGSGVAGGAAQLRLDNTNGASGKLTRFTDRLDMQSSNTIGFSTGGASTPKVWIDENGNVGIGTTNPSAKLAVISDDAAMTVIGGSGIHAQGTEFGVMGISTVGDGVNGQSTSGIGVFGMSSTGHAGYFQGKVTITDTLTVLNCAGCTNAPSDRNLKANFYAVNPHSLLERLAALPISTWSYKADAPSVRHLGPMAQDFRAAFDLGRDDKHIDMIDASGVTMASVQALYQLMLEKDGEIKQLRAQLQRQQAQLDQVRRAVRRKPAARR